MEGRILGVFLVTDILWFYVTFEAVLIPIVWKKWDLSHEHEKFEQDSFFQIYLGRVGKNVAGNFVFEHTIWNHRKNDSKTKM